MKVLINTIASGFYLEIPPYTSAIHAGGGPVRVLLMRDLTDAYEMGLGVSPMTVAAVLALVSASLLLRILWWRVSHRRVCGRGRALTSGLKCLRVSVCNANDG